MDSTDLLHQVAMLRQQGSTPKQIAKALGLKPAEATRLVRAAASVQPVAEQPVVGCWISPGWSDGLSVDGYAEFLDTDESAMGGGMATILVARRHRHDKVKVCGYLVDLYCLGVKNTYGPEFTDDLGLHRLLPLYFKAYDKAPIAAPIELAREVVFGAVDFARSIGFEPHADFSSVAEHLGEPSLSGAITFGKDGLPFFVNGPYDNPDKVIRTLTEKVGDGNFHFSIGVQ